MWDKIILRKGRIIEYINDLPKNKADIVCSRQRSMHNVCISVQHLRRTPP